MTIRWMRTTTMLLLLLVVRGASARTTYERAQL